MAAIQTSHIFVFIGLSMMTACKDALGPPSNRLPAKPLQLNIAFRPAFHERSYIHLIVSDSSKSIQILLMDFVPRDTQKDTFYWKKIALSDRQFSQLDTTLIRLCRQKIGTHYKKGWVDGMTFQSDLIDQRGDTNTIGYYSPSGKNDSIGYFFAESLFTQLKNVFQDSVINEYFDDIETYVDDSKFHPADPKRKIVRMRMEKYHWTLRKQ